MRPRYAHSTHEWSGLQGSRVILIAATSLKVKSVTLFHGPTPPRSAPDPSTGSQSGSAAPVQPQVPQRCCALPLVAVSMLPTGLCHVPSPLVPGPIPRPGDQHARNVGHVLDFVTTLSSFYSAHYSATRRMVRRRQSCFLSPSARRCSGPWVASRCHSVPKWIAYGPGAPSG